MTNTTLTEALAEIGVSHTASPISGFRTLYADNTRGRLSPCLGDFTSAEAWVFVHQAQAAA